MAFRVWSVARRVSRPQPSVMHYVSQHMLFDCTSSSPQFNRSTLPPNSRVKFIHETPIERFEVVKSRVEQHIKEVKCELQDLETMSTEFHATSTKLKESVRSDMSKVDALAAKINLSPTSKVAVGLAFLCLGFYL
ncbi:uncharacterized protein LOC119999526 isoform X1 [Tripterygium wilfordii]|uniref:uncharacterized protein LOC119999526 isoform X1 n=1 Tax=Tripterygium wilfordii TaxID=458696 RepID=UPI0018F86478|nr:uncharacterized protein LOC119999526 isoform X1 [Tripterygium wilfordii]